MKHLLALLALPMTAFADCTISWDANDPSENVTEYRLYHDAGAGFILNGPIQATSTTCSAQGIAQTGFVGVTAYNGLESEMAVAAFPPLIPSKPNSIVITITP
ncbi:MAG: hypothetical protein HKM94_08745 [Halobacteria archaeon]|nr:hypothetical protein [Halobacteria archaeon]